MAKNKKSPKNVTKKGEAAISMGSWERYKRLSRKEINSIGEAYRQVTEAKTSISTSSSSSGSDDMGFGGKGNAGLGLDGLSNWYGKPTTTTGKPTGKGHKVGYGFEVPVAVYGTIVKTIKDAGIKFDKSDPLSISRALNNAKGKKQREVVDKVAKDFGLTIDRKEILSDIEKAFDLMADYKREWAKKADTFVKKLNDAKFKVTQDLWMNPSNRTSAAVDAVEKWRNRPMGTDAGAQPGTAEAGWWDDYVDWHVNAVKKVGKFVWDNHPFNLAYDWINSNSLVFQDPRTGRGPNVGVPPEFQDKIPENDPQGAQSPRDARIANVKNAIQTKKLEKKGLFKPNTRDKVAKKLIKDVMKEHPDKGTPTFVVPKGSKEYKKLIKKVGIGVSDGHETAEAGWIPPPSWFNRPSRTGPWPVDYEWKPKPEGPGQVRPYRKPIFHQPTPKPIDIPGGGGGGGGAVRGASAVAGGLAIVVVVGGVAIYYSHKVANDPDAPENIPGFGDIDAQDTDGGDFDINDHPGWMGVDGWHENPDYDG